MIKEYTRARSFRRWADRWGEPICELALVLLGVLVIYFVSGHGSTGAAIRWLGILLVLIFGRAVAVLIRSVGETRLKR